MYLFFTILAFMALCVSGFFPETVRDSDVDLVNLSPYRRDARQLIGSKIKVNYLAALVANADELKLPINENATQTLTRIELPNTFDQLTDDGTESPYDEAGVMKNHVPDPDGTGAYTMNCMYGNIMLQLRELKDIQADSADDVNKIWSNTYQSDMVFTTTIGENSKLWAAQDKYPNLEGRSREYDSQQTCWPTHGFHLHTGSGDNANVSFGGRPMRLAGYHMGPLCSASEYFDVARRECTRCTSGQMPDWFSSIYIRKYDDAQFYDESCGGMAAKFENTSQRFLGNKGGPYFCRKLIEKIGFADLHGGLDPSSAIDPTIIQCLHQSCAKDIDIEFQKIKPVESWGFKNLHMGNYNPFPPIECKAQVAEAEDRRGVCGRCSLLSPFCESKPFASGAVDKETCQSERAGSVPWGLHTINRKDYSYSIPEYNENMALYFLPDELRFEGPDLSKYMGKTREQMQLEYCFHMNIDQTCLPAAEVKKAPTPIAVLPTKNIFVDEGNLEPPYYEFFLTEDCSSDELTNTGNDTYILESNVEYIFARCGNASTHPFNVHPLGDDPNYIGISNDTLRILRTGATGKLYEWYCSSHPTIMKGKFVAKQEDHSHRMLYEIQSQTVTPAAATSTTGDGASTSTKLASRLLVSNTKVEKNPLKKLKPARAKLVRPLSTIQSRVLLVDVATETPEGISELAQRQGWDLGERINGFEFFIEDASNITACAEAVKEVYPEANGASFDVHSKHCYASVNSTAHNSNNRYVSAYFPTVVIPPAIGFHLPNEWQINHISSPSTVSVGYGLQVPDRDNEYSGFVINGSGYVRGYTDTDNINFYTFYRFNLHEDLGTIKSWHYSIEYLDSEDAMVDTPNKNRREIIAIGANNIAQDGKPWASLHVVETSGLGKEKSLCLAGYMSKSIRKIHGIAVLPFTQEDMYLDISVKKTTLHKVEGGAGFTGGLDEKNRKYDNGMIVASITDPTGQIRTWVSSYNGVPMDTSPSNPGDVYNSFSIKWSRYAVHKVQMERDYLLMAVIDDETNTVYVWDGDIDEDESFQVIPGKGIVSDADNSRYGTKSESAIVLPIRDLYWTADEKLIVMTDIDVFMYTRIREDLPYALCQNKKRQQEINALVDPGYSWSLSHFCDLEPKPCQPGKYQDERGKQSCKNCAPGQFQPGETSTSCIECARGRFQYLEAETSCEDCMPGFFSGETGSPGLGPGEHASLMLDYVCEKCPVGYFSMEKSATHCKKCVSPDHCDIESQILPHATCTPGSDEWEKHTDHVHEYCCSTEKYSADYVRTLNMPVDWRFAPNIYCVNRRKLKVQRAVTDCGDFSKMIQDAMNRKVEDDLLDSLSRIDLDDIDNADSSDLDTLLVSLDSLVLAEEEGDDLVQARADLEANYTLELIQNITSKYIECEIANHDVLVDNNKFSQIASNVTGILRSQTELPRGVMYETQAFINDSFFNLTFEEAFSADTAGCFATVEPKTIYPQVKACCGDFADTNPQLFKEDGTLSVAPGENLYCFDVYESENVDPKAYDPLTMTMNDMIPINNEDTEQTGDDEDIEVDDLGGYLGCFIRKENYTNFHPLIPEIAECCPAAMDEVRNATWNEWDFATEVGAASCYTAANGECFIKYSFYNESKTVKTPVPAFVQEGLCQDSGYTSVPEKLEVFAEQDCPDEWESTFIKQRTIFTTALTLNGECDEGWVENFGELEYRAVYAGTCSDIGFDDVGMTDCYGSEIWKDYFDDTKYDELEWTGLPDANTIPSTCVLAPLIEVTECEYVSNVSNAAILTRECFTSNQKYTANQMEELFGYKTNYAFHTQSCTEQNPCLCARETSCSKLDTICSPENPCMCALNTTECVYSPELNVTDCECQDHVEIPSPGTSTFLTTHDNYTIYELTKTILPRDFNLVQGVSVTTGALVVNKDQWENITKDDLPLGIARSIDSWNGFYDENYLYNVKAYDTEEVLIDMKGGIDWEATRGTDEFRYCRHEFEVISDEIREMSVNMFNATANETYLVKENQTIQVTSLDAIYCSSFFPIARLADTGDWTCSSVQECPYWEFWPRPINAYGFVETDPCLCDGVKQYGGYCIPDMSYVLPKKGDPFQVAFDTHYSQVPGTEIAMSQDGSTFVTTLNDNIQAYSIGDPVIGGSVTQKGSALASSDNVAIVMSGDGTTFAKMTLFDNKLQIFGYSSQWSLQKEFSVSAQATNWNYEIIQTGTCASNGMTPIADYYDCSASAAAFPSITFAGGGNYGSTIPNCWRTDAGQTLRWNNQATLTANAKPAVCKKLPELAMSKDGKTIAVTQAGSSIQVYHMSNSVWQERASISTSEAPLYVDVSDDGSVIAFSTAGAAFIYEWENSAWVQRGDSIVDSNSQLGKIALSGDSRSIAIYKSVDKTVEVYAWKSTYWKRRGASVQADATKGLHVSSDNSVMVTCAEHVNLYMYKRKAWTLMHSGVFNAESCSLSHDGSMVGVVGSSKIKLMTTSLESDIYATEEIWVTDLDEYFKQESYEKYASECPIGSIMKASAQSNITDIDWWEDAYDRACMCDGSMCNGYAAHDLLVGLSEDIDQDKLLTMTCASDGCLYDIIDSDRWSVTEEYAKDCSGAVSEVCGIYSFGRFNDKMPFQPLYGVYDEDGDVNTGMFKCPFQNGMRRNDFRMDSTLDGGIFFRDGDFDLAPNGKPQLCACGAKTCHYNQYCRVTEDGTGFCGNTKNELETKVLEASVLDACAVVPEVIFQVELGNFAAPTDCTCGDKFCKEGQYCTSKGCRECVCGEYEYEHVDFRLSTCHEISDCELGEYVSKIQTRYSDRECAQCEHDVTYSPFQNAYSCEPCKICTGEVISKCNIVNNTIFAKVCPDGQRDRGGTCTDICERTQHEMPDGSCIDFCDYGTYFDEDQCVDCPQGTYTVKRGQDLARSGEIEDVCRPHKVCNFLTHFYAQSPNASFPGRCATRYKGHCGIRIQGDEYNDDNCTQLRVVNNRDIIRAHAFTKNISDTDFMPFDSENTVTNANAIRLKTSQYGCPAQTFVWTGSLWRGSDRELILQGDRLYCHIIGGGNFGSYSLDANYLEYEYKVVIPREHGELFEDEILDALELLETNTLSSKRATYSTFKTVARYISADLKSGFVNGYLDVELRLRTRVFAHLDARTVNKFNFVTPFSLDSVDSDIEQVFLSKESDIDFTQSPFECESIEDGIYLCVR